MYMDLYLVHRYNFSVLSTYLVYNVIISNKGHTCALPRNTQNLLIKELV